MSAPSVLASFKDGVETGRIYHNWGWISPSEIEIGLKIVRMVEKVSRASGDLTNGELGEWDELREKFYGILTREKYCDMYDMLKAIHYDKVDKSKFKLEDYFDGRN